MPGAIRMLAAAIVAACVLGVACKRDDEGDAGKASRFEVPGPGDTLIEASIAGISGLIPNITTDAASQEVGSLIYDGLVRPDRDLNWVGQMASSWTFSPDCLALTFRLRPDITWHDGYPFTANDVLFTYKTMIDPRTPTAYGEDFHAVERAEVLDPYTFRVVYSRPTAKALQSWDIWMLPKHLLEPDVARGDLKDSPLNTRPVGTGPYRFVSWKAGEKVVLAANPDYYEGRPYLDRVVSRVIPSQATIFLELQAKGVDLATLSAIEYVRQSNYPAFEKAYNKYRYPSNRYTYLGFNLKDSRFADKRVRQAFAYAIDKHELINGVLMGLGHVATGPLRPGTWAYTDKVRQYRYDPQKARALLAEAGWTDRHGRGIVEDRNGKPFSFVIRTNEGNEERKRVAEIIQQRLKNIGVSTEIQVIEWTSLIGEFIKKKQFEAVVLGWGVGLDPDQYGIWHSSQTGPGQLNQISYSNPEVDAMLEKGRASCHRQERVKYYHRLQELLAEDQPVVFLYFQDALPVVSSRVHGIAPSPAGIFYNFTKWYVPTQLQRYTAN
jgi:peptide/nickel transport system substrate-binding protein